MVTSAYVHIPFCRRRCFYCDFPISVLGDRIQGEASGSIVQYIEVLGREIALTKPTAPLETIFFGGGTPSLLAPSQLGLILDALAAQFGIREGAEISLEIDPDTFTLEQVQGYQALGVNRFSLGVQAFQDELLHRAGRSHSREDIFQAVGDLRQGGIVNFSLDLISGLPGQTLTEWEESLKEAIALAPTHISCYDLVLEPVTAFGKQYEAGKHPLPSDEITAQMYRTARDLLTSAGFEHYEISNYAQKGWQCRHNRVYWENRPYWGFGMGAASYVGGRRLTRPRTRREYYDWVEGLSLGTGETEGDVISECDRLLETLMLGLRLSEGLKLANFSPEITQKILTGVQPYIQQGWVIYSPHSTRLQLTDPDGFLFSNTILSDLFNLFS
ncbi:radical SAM family heme chaperone HemW [Spirulina subsalsa FACHB-351]|uniref:Heme chaperone HemW n=2 Tax=Spirulina subsalsa TaxID=54311 RepID=A0ABT3L2C1_9CYAN|nr:radical SAM family heme chaperone HemW [Spirulina subsalsa FACHB-351]